MRSLNMEVLMPDNSGFYHAAYVVAVAIYVLYALSIRRRAARLGTSR